VQKRGTCSVHMEVFLEMGCRKEADLAGNGGFLEMGCRKGADLAGNAGSGIAKRTGKHLKLGKSEKHG